METFSTGDAVLFSNGLNMGRISTVHHIEHIGSWNIDAGLNTAKTHDTSIRPLPNQRGSVFKSWPFNFFGDELLMVNPKFIGSVLELTFSSGIADRTVQRVIDQ
jgi:hypothetical protein